MNSAPRSPKDPAGRRRLLRAVPALTVLPSAPVLAANCKLPSGFSVSGNLSRAGGNPCSDPAPLPSAWAGMIHKGDLGKRRYNGAGLWVRTPFNDLFPGGTKDTLEDVLASGNLNQNALFATVRLQAIATKGGPGFPTEEEVLRMWTDTRNGLYSPTVGVSWSRDDVLKYLRYLSGQSI